MSLKRYLILALLLVVFNVSFAQTSGSITVGGDFDKFYPVTWNDPAWGYSQATILKLGRSSVHENVMWRGALISTFTYHLSQFGHGAHFIDASIKNSIANFIAGWHDATTGGSSAVMIIWLRGGGTTYYFNANYPVTATIYDGIQNPLPFQQHNGPAHSYKSTIDSYVNSDGSSSSGAANFASGGSNYFAGNVGIGTVSPVGKLDIQAESAFPIRTSTSQRYIMELKHRSDAGGGWWFANDPNGNFSIHENGVGDRVTIQDATGFVGIGTTSPNEMLSVNGKIRAHEIKVETTNWPDYVFTPEHKRLSLTELSKYIKANKHLPEIPSAAEAEQEGVSLGEMNAKLLKKIEELTLYVIELKEELETVKRKTNNLKD